jgi:acyl carrier protein
LEQKAALTEIESVYREVRGGTRSLRPEDLLEDDLDIDSLTAMELLVGLEDRYGFELIGDGRTTEIRTVGDLMGLLSALGAERAATT